MSAVSTSVPASSTAKPVAKTPAAARENKTPSWQKRLGYKGALFGVPFFVGFLFVFIIPLFYAIYESLFKRQSSGLGIGEPTLHFSGLAQYARVMQDHDFWVGMGRVAIYSVVVVPIIMGFALAEALLIDSAKARAKKSFRFILLIPYMVPTIVSTLMWVYLYSPDIGPLRKFFLLFGLDVNFFSAGMLWVSMANLLLWTQVGFNMLILYGSLTALDPALLEAARVDGASELRIAWSIKIPQIRGSMLLTGLLSFIGMLQLFDQPLLFRSASPQTVTANFTPIMTIYNYTFTAGGDYNYAAALSVVLAIVIGILSALIYGFSNRKK
ncbi:carbohydrate ABC transporter permease [Bifidobacterium callimiconis]|uniref:ABC transporter permease n=1 Tax=Bifidobacterium callimiconis TaxID=2306973 RepID=A0A430F9L1_9BIFI|nr:sugar ABC transporter permease [Bifidobacterium callimiconis]MBT1175969.1 sugar ABC transporter permease [Bifidobacterium callimiconis]RSX49520.1 ABC transporter permease [Bifidobacterium callimiconis]